MLCRPARLPYVAAMPYMRRMVGSVAVNGLVIDPTSDQVTHLILQEGHLWGRKHVAIPIGAANRVEDEIRVDLTKEEIEALPPVSHGSGR